MSRRFSQGRGRQLTRYESIAEHIVMTPLGYRYLRHVAPRVDRVLIPRTRGRWSSVGRGLIGMVTTTGAKTGLRRPQPVLCIADEDGSVLVVGSNYGRPHHPGWVHNLRSDGRCSVTFGGSTRACTAREVAWQRAVDWTRAFAAYERKAHPRTIGLFRLVPEA